MAAKSIYDLLRGETRFGKLTVIGEGEPYAGASHPIRRARCLCDCGEFRDMQPAKLVRGKFVSCGCVSADNSRARFTKHGGYKTATYRTWNAMMARCHNPKSSSYDRYGGVGITVCDRWRDPSTGFLLFAEDMGSRPDGTTIDRIDSSLGYFPGNCRWATRKQQQRNIRTNRVIEFEGKSRTAAEWADALGLKRNAFYERLRAGWPLDRLMQPPLNRP